MLVDDHPLIRDSLRELVTTQKDMVLVGEADNGRDALQMIQKLRPAIVVLDLNLPDISGLDIARQLNQDGTGGEPDETKVIILSVVIKENIVFDALTAGVRGYIVKTASGNEIIQAIKYVHHGHYYLSPEVSNNIIPEYLKGHGSTFSNDPYNSLTNREQQIFRMLAEGKTNKDISEILSISQKTVERHRANIMGKLKVRSYRDLLKYAIDLGILEE